MGASYSNSPGSSYDNLETFSLLWLDASINTTHDNVITQQNLQSIFNQLKTFENSDDCINYINSLSVEDRVVLVVSGQLGRDIVPRIHSFQQLVSIYVYCQNQQLNEQWSSKYLKVKGVVTDLNELITRIEWDHDKRQQSRIYQPLPISIFDSKTMHAKLTTDLRGKLVQSQLLINCLLQMEDKVSDKNELVKKSRQIYEKDQLELNIIREFEQNYSSERAIWWYTRNSFLSRLLNKALRTQNVDILFLFHFLVVDIRQQLEKIRCTSPVKVFRSQLMPNKEMKKLQNAVGQFISINSFFSATNSKERALSFLENSDGLERVLFEVFADPRVNNDKPFADIQPYRYDHEEEVLFMLGSVFEIVGVKRDRNGIWIVSLELVSDNGQQLDLINDKEKLLPFGHVLMTMGKIGEAEIYYRRLLEQLPLNNPDCAPYYEALGSVAVEKNNYDGALRLLEQSLEINMINLNKNHPDIGSNFNSIGDVYRKKGDHVKALEYYNNALEILSEKSKGKALAERAVCLNNIGIVYQEQKRYQQALDCYNQAFKIRQKYFLSDEVSLGMSCNNIGNIYYFLRDYDKALDNYKEALAIYKRSLPPQHIKFASTYNNIGAIYDDQGKLDDALAYYTNALKIYGDTQSTDHPNVIKIQENIQRIRAKKKE